MTVGCEISELGLVVLKRHLPILNCSVKALTVGLEISKLGSVVLYMLVNMARSNDKNKQVKKALKEKEGYEIRGFRGSAVNILHGFYFTLMSKTGPGMKYFNYHFDVPSTIVLNELIYIGRPTIV